MEDAIKSDTFHISALINVNDEKDVKAILVLMVIDHVKFFSVGKSMDDGQVVNTVNLIISEYGWLKLEDIAVCFKNRRLGKYGKLFDVLDGSIILQDLSTYVQERMNLIDRAHNQQKTSTNSPLAQGMPEDIKEEFEKVLPKFKPQVTDFKQQEKSEMDIKLNTIYKEFDTMHEEQGRNDGSIRMVMYNGELLDVYKFIEKKLK